MSEKNNNTKVILITGCSSGFGMLSAALLAEKGHKVIATMRNLQKKMNLVNEVQQREAQVDIQCLDVTDTSTIDDLFSYITHNYGYLDVVINNAGYFIGGAFETLGDDEFRQQMETNFFGVLNVTRRAIPLMRSRQSPKIINISSVAGFSASPCFAAYNASKWALEGFSEALYYELKMFGIGVHLIEPGAYKTNIFSQNARVTRNFNNEQSPYYHVHQHLKNLVEEHLKDNHKDPQEVADLVLRIVEKKNAPFRNIPDIESRFQRIARKILPFSMYSNLVKKAYLGKLPPDY